tara:strand:+ start:2345 stop:2971 length:627 start_codon:yes stop_codon:yes gene_type:complete
MKVTIGSYPHRLVCDLHTNHMRKKYGFDWPEPTRFDNLVEEIEDSIQSVYDVFNWIWFDRRTQQIKVRIDKSDTWSMDHTLGHIILPMLVQLKATKHGAPCTEDEDVLEELRSTNAAPKENDWDTDDNHFKRWDWILDEMIWAFNEKCRDDWEGDFYEYRELGPEEDKGDSRFGFKLVWEDKEGRKAHAARMANGFILFGKYYENLWD